MASSKIWLLEKQFNFLKRLIDMNDINVIYLREKDLSMIVEAIKTHQYYIQDRVPMERLRKKWYGPRPTISEGFVYY